MSTFPYNKHTQNDADTVNGCPIDYREALALADKLRFWHGCIAETDNWTQSNDGAWGEIVNIAFGLMEMFSDPSAVRRLEIVGDHVRQSVERLLDMDTDRMPPVFSNAQKVVGPLFENENKEDTV